MFSNVVVLSIVVDESVVNLKKNSWSVVNRKKNASGLWSAVSFNHEKAN